MENSATFFFWLTQIKKKKKRFRILSHILFFLPRITCFFPSTKISFWVYCIFQDKIQSVCVFVRYCFVENSAPIFFVNTKCKKKKRKITSWFDCAVWGSRKKQSKKARNTPNPQERVRNDLVNCAVATRPRKRRSQPTGRRKKI